MQTVTNPAAFAEELARLRELVAAAGHAAGVQETSMWRWAGTGALYGLRAAVAFPSTITGARRALLAATPLPGKPAVTTKDRRALPPPNPPSNRGETKKAALLRLYADHPDHGDRTKVSAVAAGFAPQAGLQARTARTYLYAAVNGTLQ